MLTLTSPCIIKYALHLNHLRKTLIFVAGLRQVVFHWENLLMNWLGTHQAHAPMDHTAHVVWKLCAQLCPMGFVKGPAEFILPNSVGGGTVGAGAESVGCVPPHDALTPEWGGPEEWQSFITKYGRGWLNEQGVQCLLSLVISGHFRPQCTLHSRRSVTSSTCTAPSHPCPL